MAIVVVAAGLAVGLGALLAATGASLLEVQGTVSGVRRFSATLTTALGGALVAVGSWITIGTVLIAVWVRMMRRGPVEPHDS